MINVFKKTYAGVMAGFSKTVDELGKVIQQENEEIVKLSTKKGELESAVVDLQSKIKGSDKEITYCEDAITAINKLFPGITNDYYT